MAIERFVKHVEGLNQHQLRAQAFRNGASPNAKVAHLGNDLVKLKNLLKQALHKQNRP